MLTAVRRLRTRASGSILLAFAAAAVACGGASSATESESPAPAAAESPSETAPVSPTSIAVQNSSPHVISGQLPSGQGRIIVTMDDDDVPVDNGARLQLGSGVVAELCLDPFPPATLSMLLDVYLEIDGQPVEDGSVAIEYDMLAMVHGPFTGTAQSIGGGHFIVPLDYIMFGAWDQALTIRAEDRRLRLPVVIVARP